MNKSKGFTLIEVLITMLLLAIGLLGLATLQTYTLKSNLQAYHRGQSIQLLYDMSDRMRANKAVASSYVNAPGSTKVAACNTYSANPTCTAANLVNNDLIEWNTAIAATLPLGSGSITSTASNVFVLSISWDDNRDGTVPPNDPDDPTFTMSLQL